MLIHLVQLNQQNKIKFISLTLEGERVTREWGLLGGISQGILHDYEPINKGKANELTPEQAAEADFNRIIERKEKEGYVRTDSLETLPELKAAPLDLDHIPKSFCCSKPIKQISIKATNKLIKSGHAKFFVKYNGGCHYILINSEGVIFIYTRRWDDHTSKYPDLVKAVKKKNFRPSTLLIAELCIDPLLQLPHMIAQQRFSEIQKANTTKGVCKEDQTKCFERQTGNTVKAAVFGILYFNGEKVWDKPYSYMWDLLTIPIEPLSQKELLFLPQEADITSGDAAVSLTKVHSKALEGLILWDMRKSMEVTFNGKPLRRAAWKIKPEHDDDVIAYGGKFGKNPKQYGSLYIGKYDDKGKMVPLGTVGGLKPKNGETDPKNWEFPCVVEITYSNIFPDTGFYQFGSFSKIHEDKQLSEVELFSL
jgi:ATP-dependent DNA ligase